MNVASLELCKELYELSGWRVIDKPSALVWMKGIEGSTIVKHWNEPDVNHWEFVCPAYPLGYLLRKLPGFYINKVWSNNTKSWYFRVSSAGLVVDNANPENATSKLCIELFKSGVLKK